MIEEKSDKMLKPTKDKYFFPDSGRVVEAESQEDAEKKLKEISEKVIIKNK
jgi:hypothetical protein